MQTDLATFYCGFILLFLFCPLQTFHVSFLSDQSLLEAFYNNQEKLVLSLMETLVSQIRSQEMLNMIKIKYILQGIDELRYIQPAKFKAKKNI